MKYTTLHIYINSLFEGYGGVGAAVGGQESAMQSSAGRALGLPLRFLPHILKKRVDTTISPFPTCCPQ